VEVEKTSESIREAAHGDGSDKWANELEESVMDLENEKHENAEKAQERRARHQHDHEVREELLHERLEALAGKDKASSSNEAIRIVDETPSVVRNSADADVSNSFASKPEDSLTHRNQEKSPLEEKETDARSSHAPEKQVREEVSHAHLLKPLFGNDAQPADKDQASDASDAVQSSMNMVLFIVFAIVLGGLVWWRKFVNSNSHSVSVPGVGKLNMVQSERTLKGIIAAVAPNSSLGVYAAEDTRASAPLKAAFTGREGGYGVYTLR